MGKTIFASRDVLKTSSFSGEETGGWVFPVTFVEDFVAFGRHATFVYKGITATDLSESVMSAI